MRKKYLKTGQCNGCGRCCQEIYVKHSRGVIKDEDEYKKLKKIHPFYSYLEVKGKTETGLVFECKKLDKETGRCTIYRNRALICRLYPQEEIFAFGGFISEKCGYSFTPLESFEEVMGRVNKKGKWLHNDEKQVTQ